ncbi:GNAT family N-acetyltransferase [Hoeflea sp. BAL378]|uniref:GNAT family N-acetyltransferase n=1 Tax=Hoeflea sp. BAL378 TaxID=1547437 RepID=UPI000690BA73|nr:GNAT family N-acetyltransferase [Hoeflea sp. BAL378]
MPTLRPATPSDIPAIIAISQSAYWSNFRDLEPGAWDHPGYRELVRDMHRTEARDFWPDITLAEFDGVAGGWGARFRGRNEISEMWVHADFQGKGAGTALLRRFLEGIAAEGHPEAWIETHRRNAGAIRLYRRVGFVPDHEVSRVSKGLGRDIPLIRLRRPLP